MFVTYRILSLLIVCIFNDEATGTIINAGHRQGRLILGPRPTSVVAHERYPFCRVGNTTGACLNDFICDTEEGSFLGYCNGNDGVCCNVVKSCGSSTSSHEVSFQNPLFPERETKPKVCILKLNVGRGICAMRLQQDFFELRNYDSDYCPSDTLTILGSKNITTPICGNMTGWATTFEVDELSQVQLAMIVQGRPSYKFSTRLSMLACDQILPMNSPINAGIRNADAVKYTTTEAPTTTTTESTTTAETTAETTTEETTTGETTIEETTTGETTIEDIPEGVTTAEETTTEEPVVSSDGVVPDGGTSGESGGESGGESSGETTSFLPPRRSNDEDGGRSTSTSTEKSTTATQSTLPTGTFKTVGTITTPSILFSSSEDPNQSEDLITGSYDPTPQNSIFNRIFSSRSGGEQCLRYEDPEAIYRRSIFRDKRKDKCYHYDTFDGRYKVSDECDITDEEEEEPSFRVVGGKYANLNEYPWQVALIYKKRFFCGGALISDRHILTASHCAFGSFSTGINNLIVSLGDHDLKTINETKNRAIGVKRVIWNLHYSSDTTENDIAIFELSKPVDFSYNISPVKLPTELDDYYKGQKVIVTGWGRHTLKSKKTSTLLREYQSTVQDIGSCVKKWKPYPSISAFRGMHICLNVTHGTPCHGDSGGPLVACIEDQCTIVGVVSFGFPLCKNVGLPAVFSRVSFFKRWININTTPVYYQDVGPQDKK